MQNKPLRNDLFLYDLVIRVLAFWTTILFSLLFFTGAKASEKSEPVSHKIVNQVALPQHDINSDKK